MWSSPGGRAVGGRRDAARDLPGAEPWRAERRAVGSRARMPVGSARQARARPGRGAGTIERKIGGAQVVERWACRAAGWGNWAVTRCQDRPQISCPPTTLSAAPSGRPPLLSSSAVYSTLVKELVTDRFRYPNFDSIYTLVSSASQASYTTVHGRTPRLQLQLRYRQIRAESHSRRRVGIKPDAHTPTKFRKSTHEAHRDGRLLR
jgi:hypothetical protein